MALPDLLQGMIDSIPEIAIDGLTLDSREVQQGDAFVALAGTRFHGLEFVDEALSRGCSVVLWEPAQGIEAPQGSRFVPVEGLAQRLGVIADRFFGQPSSRTTLIGVTGTNGKSSCVQFLAQAVDGTGHSAASLGTLGWGLLGREAEATHTTPDAITVHRQIDQLAESGAEFVAMEVSSHALDQGRVNGLRFDGAVFTNLSRDHLDYHGEMDAYRQAKSRLFASPGLRFAILNADDRSSEGMAEALGADVQQWNYGIDAGQVRAEHIQLLESGLRFELTTADGSVAVEAGLLGRFNVYNLLAVASTLLAMGWSLDQVRVALCALQPVPGRMNRMGGGDRPLVVVDYAHTPDALEQSLKALRGHTSGRLICVFGCGGDRDRGKRAQMAAAAESLSDRVIITDDNPRTEDGDQIVQDILKGLSDPDQALVERDRAQAIAAGVEAAGPGDAVLIAGKGHETYQEINGRRLPFDDRETAQQVLEAVA